MASAGGIRAARAFVEFYLDATKLDAGIKSLSARLKSVASEMKDISTKVGLAFAPLAAAIGASVKQFSGFDDVMRSVASVAGASGREITMLRDKAAELGRTTSFTASQVGEAMLNLARAGFKPDEIEKMTGPMLNLSRASGTELAQAADIAAVALRSFALNASETNRVADVLVATANNSAQTLTELGEALKYVAPVAADAGMSLEDTALTIGIMANYGIRGSMAGTAMRQALLRLANPEIQKQLQSVFGVTVTDAQGNMRRLHEILKDLDKAMEGIAASERVAAMQEIFDLRGMSVGLKVAQADLSQLEGAITNAGGTAERVAVEMDAGLGGGFRMLASAVEGVAISIGDALAPALLPIIAWITSGVTVLAEWIKEHQQWAVAIAAVVAAIVILTGTVFAVSTALQVLTGVIAMVRAAMIALTWSNPFTAILGAITMIIGALIAMVSWLRSGNKEMAKSKEMSDAMAKSQRDAQRQQLEMQRQMQEEQRRAAEQQEAERKRLKTQEALEFEAGMEDRVHEARIAMIEDELEREIAAINHRYEKELEKARELGANVAKVEAARAAEIEAAKTKAARKRAEDEQRERERLEEERKRFVERLDEDLAEARIDASLEGTERELAKLQLEKQRALAEAATLGVSPEKIEELYRLKEEAIRKSETPDITAAARFTSGFSGFAILAQGAGPVAETAKNTLRMTKQLAELNSLLGRNLQFN